MTTLCPLLELHKQKALRVAQALEMNANEVAALVGGFESEANPRRGCVLVFPDDGAIRWAQDLGRILGARAFWRLN